MYNINVPDDKPVRLIATTCLYIFYWSKMYYDVISCCTWIRKKQYKQGYIQCIHFVFAYPSPSPPLPSVPIFFSHPAIIENRDKVSITKLKSR